MADRFADADELFARVFEGDVDDATRAQLSELLRHDPAMRERFLSLCRMNLALGEAMGIEPVAATPRIDPARVERPIAPPRGAWIVPTLAAAAVLLVAGAIVSVYFLSGLEESSNPYDDIPFATVIDTSGDLYVDDDFGVAGRDYAAGRFNLPSGSADLMLENRVTIGLRGRTQLAVHNPMSATISSGSATFECPPEAVGYTVYLPGGARVVDLGTRFRITLDESGAARVEVLDGKVEVRRGETERILLTRAATALVPHNPSSTVLVTNDPPVLSDATVWLKADAITGVEDGEPVAAWPGSSVAGHGAESNAAGSPVLVHDATNGLPVVRFAGAQRMTLPTADELGLLEGDYEIYVVARTDRPQGQFLLAADTPKGVAHYELHVNHPWLEVGFNFLPQTDVHLTTGAKQQYVGGLHIFGARLIDGVAYAAVDGGPAASGAVSGPRSDLPLVLGARGDGTFPLIGDLAEVLIFDRRLDEEERTQVLDHLRDRFGIGVQADQTSLEGDVR